MYLSVIICTYNPSIANFDQVVESLKRQTLEREKWELLVIDNGSTNDICSVVDLSWHPHAKLIREERAGLSYARIKGVVSSNTELIVFVDDDNLLDAHYLEISYQFHRANPGVGCFGGRSLPLFEVVPPIWFSETGINLGCQDYGNEPYVSNYSSQNFALLAYPQKAPIGTGMVILKNAFLVYMEEVSTNAERLKLGRKGQSLSSGEDNDIILTIVKKGFEIAYVPRLVVHHLIPSRRLTSEYLSKMAFESNRTWVWVLAFHGICPWRKINKWSYGIRKLKAYFTFRAWETPLAAIKWKASCGTFKGLAEL